MKKIVSVLLVLTLITACNNSSKDSVEKADSINKTNPVVSNESSAEFLVRTANSGMAEVEVTALGQQKAQNQEVKDLAAMLNQDHKALNDAVKNLATKKNITLPDSITSEKRQMITDLDKKSGKDFDKEFLNVLIKAHEGSIESFEKTIKDETDADIKNFAEQTLPKLRDHLNNATTLKNKLFPG